MTRRFADLPLKQKLLLVITGTSVLALATACAGFFAYEIVSYRDQAGRDLDLRAAMLAAAGAPALAFRDAKDAAETLAVMKVDPHVVAAQFYTSDGAILGSYARADARGEPPERPGSDGRLCTWDRHTIVQGVDLAGRRIGTVRLARDLGEMRGNLAAVLAISLFLLLASSLTALAIAARTQRMISEPILDLTRAAKTISKLENYSARAPVRGRDELGDLVRAFNDMLDQIQSRDALNKELESFSYSVSHDLRGPLRAINGFGRLVLSTQGDRLDAEGKDYLERIAAAARRMSEVIDDLLNLSRVTRSAMKTEPVDLSALARDVAGELRALHPERTVEVAIDDGIRVSGDAHLLQLGLENLLSNAWKFTARTAAPRIEVRSRREDGIRVLSVRDNGAGFDPAYANKLFKPFSRLHSESEFTGTGIGLATVARIIERHGGRIWAEGAVGKGAVFHFTLPEA